MKTKIIEQTYSMFTDKFGVNENIVSIAIPASIILLGDHTHYNDGLTLSCSIDRYAVAIFENRVDDNINIFFSDCDLNYITSLGHLGENDFSCGQISFGPLLEILKEEKLLKSGFNCLINSNIPSSIGLGNISAHQIALIMALRKAQKLELSDNEVISLARRAELNYVGKISNRAHHQTVLNSKKNAILFNDIRTDSIKLINLNGNSFKVIICDTGKVIENISDICNERISECKVGVDGLRLYIWGIKNLRDVNLDFLEKHFHMIPKRVYSRVLYNVKERLRVEKAADILGDKKIENVKEIVKESHFSLRNEYEIGSEEVDFLVNNAVLEDGVIASKMISCSPIVSTYNIVKTENADDFVAHIKEEFNSKFGKKLITYSLNIVDGYNN